MVATQVGLSALLLVCPLLVVRSLQRALDAPVGYNPKGGMVTTCPPTLGHFVPRRLARGSEIGT
jgi:hypothetical protein